MDAAALPAPWREFARQAGPYVRDRGPRSLAEATRATIAVCAVTHTTYGSKPLHTAPRFEIEKWPAIQADPLACEPSRTSREATQMGKDQAP